MGLVNAVYSWSSVKALHYIVFSMNLAGILALLLAVVWAVRFERGFGDYLNLVTPGDGHVWTTVIISAAIFCSPAYVLGVKSCLCLKLEPIRSDLEDQQKIDSTVDPHDVNRLLFFHVVACLLSGFLVAVLNATYLVLLSGFQQKSRDGLIEAIEKYGSDVAMKTRVDAIQTELECCGDNGYQDWFHVPWIKLSVEGPEESEEGPRLEEQSIPEDQDEEPSATADVPFSCCSNDIPKPCVHHDILNPSAVYDYNPKRLTIATLGCRSKIISRGETIRIFLTGYLTLLSIYQIVLSALARLLQTAYSNEFYIGPQKNRYHVWILFKPEDAPDNMSLIRQTELKQSRSERKLLNRNSASSSASASSNEEEEANIATKLRKTKSTGAKVLKKIRSKISSVKAKSLPLIKPSRIFSRRRRRKKKLLSSSEDESEDAEPQEGEKRRESDRKERHLSNRKTKSEFGIQQDHFSTSSSSDNSSATNLPSPPPPPPLVANLEIENEETLPKIEAIRRSRLEIKPEEPLYDSIVANQNSGRRVKVLEEFGKIWHRKDHATQRREGGGADKSSNSGHSSRSNRSRRPVHKELGATDVYDRFRGTLQHTLARREAIRVRRGSGRQCASIIPEKQDFKRNSVLARLRYDNVPPSYRLLANVNAQRRSISKIEEKPPPPAPLPLLSQTAWTGNSSSGSNTRQQRHCSVCKRPVSRTLESSGECFIDRDARILNLERCRDTSGVPTRENECLRRDHVNWARSACVSRSAQRR